MQKENIEINVWTVNDREDMKRLMELGVNAVITNYPDMACEVRKEYFT